MAKKKTVKKKAKKKKTGSKIKSGSWLQSRKVLFRPKRFEYIAGQRGNVQRNTSKESCVFCNALKSGLTAESLVVAETIFAMVVLNKYPYNPGHIMVLPKRHHGDLLTLKNEEYFEVMNLVRVSVEALKKAFHANDFNIGINLGKGAGAGIPEHLHVHIVPRWPGDFNFFPLIAETKVIPSDLPTVYARLKPALEELLSDSKDFK